MYHRPNIIRDFFFNDSHTCFLTSLLIKLFGRTHEKYTVYNTIHWISTQTITFINTSPSTRYLLRIPHNTLMSQ